MNKGTLTILADGKIVLGFPKDDNGSVASPSEMKVFSGIAHEWVANGKSGEVLALPFPVDVVDMRAVAQAIIKANS